MRGLDPRGGRRGGLDAGGDPAGTEDRPERIARARIAAELHGGILQEMTAAGLELRLLLDTAEPGAKPAIERARDILGEQQRRLRDYVTELRVEPGDGQGLLLDEAMEGAVAALRRQSAGRLGWDAWPRGARIPKHEMLQLRPLLAEAVGEAIGHHGAAEIMVSVELDRTLRITLTHDGKGPVAAATASLDARLRELGGTCRRMASAIGGTLLIELPRI